MELAPTFLAHLFWLTLWIPGQAALLRVFPRARRFGWFGRLGLAYLAAAAGYRLYRVDPDRRAPPD